MNLSHRPRRLRSSPALRNMVRETTLHASDFILPLFVSEKISARVPVPSMPGVFQLTEQELVAEATDAHRAGVHAVLLFGIPSEKDERASQAYADSGVVQRAVRALKKSVPGLIVVTDVCLCEFMSHGHCGVAHFHGDEVHVENDASVELLAKAAVSHAAAGADIVAPSDMMDGRIGAIRSALDAAESTPQAGDRRSYQMDSANALEALREVELDIEEGADIVMVKPGLAYLDILWRVKDRFGLPTAAYNVSGEYAMIKAAAANGWLDERATVLEAMTAFKRAGADLIITYWAKQIVGWL